MFHFPLLQKMKQNSATMVLPRSIAWLPFFMIIVFATIIPRYDCLQEELTLNDYHEEAMSPSYFSGLEDGKFMGSIKQGTDVLRLKSQDRIGTTTTTTTSTSAKEFSVDDFGVKADDPYHNMAFEKAWEQACKSSAGHFVVPKNTYRLKPIRFTGPCKSKVEVKIYGIIKASGDRKHYEKDMRHWILFDNVKQLTVEGGGTIDGNGKIWWQNSCKTKKKLPCKGAPTAVTFYKCNDLTARNLRIQNAQQMHVTFESSKNVKVSHLTVTAPKDSPNTDGIHVTATRDIQITDSVIRTGDDCISIVNGSQNVQVRKVECGPGHGISIGSLGKGNSKVYVLGVTVDGAKLSGTTNGVRIKTWEGGCGSARNIIFRNIKMENVTYPIIINQHYLGQDKPCKEHESAVQVKNVTYENITGTNSKEVAIKLDCGNNHSCQDILLKNVRLSVQGRNPGEAKCQCNNVAKLIQFGDVKPRCPSGRISYWQYVTGQGLSST